MTKVVETSVKYLKTVMLATALIAVPACSQSSVNVSDKEAIGKIVHEYIMENPELVMDALVAHEENQNWDSINEVKTAIYDEKRDVVMGPDNAKVTIVEFFDYNCTYCKRTTDWVANVLEEHPNDVRVIFKETPILDSRTRTSINASKAALAAARQDKYFEMHMALMNANRLTDDRIDELAEENGVNVKKMREDMEDPEIVEHVENTMTLIRKIRPFNGTPFFLFEDEFVAGASVERLDEMLDKALSN